MRRRLPPLRTLEAFVVAAHAGSLRAAAERLHLTDSAVCRQIQALEADLGEPLLLRRRDGLRPTSAGHALLAVAEPALADLERAAESIRAPNRSPVLRVACDPCAAALWLMPRLLASGPERLASVALVPEAALPDDAHVAIGWEQGARASAAALIPDAFGPVGRSGALEPALSVASWPEAWTRWRAAARAPDPPLAGSAFPSLGLALQAARAGSGAVIAPHAFVVEDLAAGRLVAPLGFRPLGRSLVARRTRRDPGRAIAAAERRFLRWLREPTPPQPGSSALWGKPSGGVEG
jgi:DNA-binding transcriptional LysR family regulator